jgi:hypothetical protein
MRELMWISVNREVVKNALVDISAYKRILVKVLFVNAFPCRVVDWAEHGVASF